MREHQTITGAARLAHYGEGPWIDEPDRVEWHHVGYPCVLIRHARLGHWCGYVGVPRGHPWYGLMAQDFDLRVYNGISFADYGAALRYAESDDLWWVGFNCGHNVHDFRPLDQGRHNQLTSRFYKRRSFAQAYVEGLARQAREASAVP